MEEENRLSGIIVDACLKIHMRFGPGLFESVYEEILFHELKERKCIVERQKVIPVTWNDLRMDRGFRADLIINKRVLIEVKSIEVIAPVHSKQVLTYLRLTGMKLGLLVNFNEELIKNGIRRIINNL